MPGRKQPMKDARLSKLLLWAAEAQSCGGTCTELSSQHLRSWTQALYPWTPDGHWLRVDPLECQFLQHTLGKAVDRYGWAWRVLRHLLLIYCCVANYHKLSNLKQHIYFLSFYGARLEPEHGFVGSSPSRSLSSRNQDGSLGWGLSWKLGWRRIWPDVTLSSLTLKFS